MNQFSYRPGQKTDVVIHLIIVNVLFFVVHKLFVDESQTLIGRYIFSEQFRPWQIVTHMFMHDRNGLYHIFFNMFGLWMFGRILASIWGWKRFLFFYFTCGFVAFFAHQIYLFTQYGTQPYDIGLLGASGAVYGVLAGFAVLFPNTQLMLLFPPIPIKAKYLVTGLILLDLYLGFSNKETGIAHFAHLGGALAGFLIVKYWQKNSKTFY